MTNDIDVPILRNDEETLEQRMSANAYNKILPARYLEKDEDGEIVEEQEDLFERVARNVSVAEAVFEDNRPERHAPDTAYIDVMENEPYSDEARMKAMHWKDKFHDHMSHLKFMPNTPTLINAGTPMQQLSACFVLSPEDDMDDIHQKAKEAALVFQSGGGCGYDFSKLRPYGDVVKSTGGIASGPITFMNTFDQVCETVAQGGVRRGAQMATMRIDHPDVIHFIHAKNKDVSLAHTLRLNDPDDPTYTDFSEALGEARGLIEDGKVPKHLRNAVEGHLSNFNISVTVTDEFMEALQNEEEFTLKNPRTGNPHITTPETKEMYAWFGIGVSVGEELSVPASEIWDSIVEGAYENGEPGVVYIDTVNDEHSFDVDAHPEYEQITTNPCAEQPLMNYEACNLGHINLSTVVSQDREVWSDWNETRNIHSEYTSPPGVYDKHEHIEDFLDQAIDWEELNDRIEVGTRFLDNVVTMSDFPVDAITETVRKNRKIGLGIMGLAQLYIQLGVEYGSVEGNEIARQLMRHINYESKNVSHGLAQERGVFENWPDSKYADTNKYWSWLDEHVGYWEDLEDRSGAIPMRNHNTTTVAPTGTTSMLADTTGGCEPIYNVAYYKNVTDDIQGDEMLVEFDSLFLKMLEINEDVDVEEVKEECASLMQSNEFDGISSLSSVPEDIAHLFVTTSDLDSKAHASVLCSLQDGVDSSISKCVSKGTMIQTDQGVFRVEDMGDADEKGEDSFSETDSNYTCSSNEVVEHYYGGECKVTEIRLDNGATIEGATDTHKVMTSDGWKVLGEIEEGDVVFRDFKESHGEGGAPLKGKFEQTPWSNEVEVPSEMSEEYAEILGMLAADGCAVESNGTVHLTAEKDVVSDRFCDLCREVFAVDPYHKQNIKRTDDFWFTSKDICKQITNLIGTGSYTKEVPDEIISGSAEEKLSFLKGITLDGYDDNLGFTVYEGMSEKLADGIEAICRSFGLPNVYRGRRYVQKSDSYAHSITVSNEMQEIVETVDPGKNNDIHYKPYKVFFDRGSHKLSEWSTDHEKYSAVRSLFQREKNHMYNETAEALGLSPEQPVSVVTDVEETGTEEVYDIEVEETHRYVTNGIISHNTLNAPYKATVEDAKETFEYVYHNGGKSVTFYRDGSRTKQVLTTRQDNQETGDEESEEENAPTSVYPRERPDDLYGPTKRIETPAGTLYVTINEDENGLPFETFIEIGKSGSMTKSFTEGIARLVSLNLRSGVPIEEVIDQLENIRSPEVAWDNGETIESVPDAVATALRRYIDEKDGTSSSYEPITSYGDENDRNLSGSVCPDCGSALVYVEGCEECPSPSCGFSKC